MSDEIQLNAENKAERSTLKKVLAINLSQVGLAGTVGFLANSTGLLGSALDSLADAAVYIVSLYAVGKSGKAKARAARLSGIFLIFLGVLLLVEAIRRFLGGGEPVGIAMIITAIVNAFSNWWCLKLLRTHQRHGAHMKAAVIFTGNDTLVNLGIVLSAIAVMIFKSSIPDLLIGIALVGISLKGGIEILKEANKEEKS